MYKIIFVFLWLAVIRAYCIYELILLNLIGKYNKNF